MHISVSLVVGGMHISVPLVVGGMHISVPLKPLHDLVPAYVVCMYVCVYVRGSIRRNMQ